MEQTDANGPDGSSLRPVSSLRARFENLNDAAPQHQQKPPSRPISPAPKPDKLRDFKPTQDAAAATPTTPTGPTLPLKPKPKPKPAVGPSAHQHDGETTAPPPLPLATKPSTAVKPFTPKPHLPSVTVQPPQSPPKGRLASLAAEEQPALLNPDSVTTPATPGGTQPLNAPGTPTTPTPAIPPPRSPRGSKAPSPPPPRRSGDLRREPKPAPPPPAPRRDKESGLNLPAISTSHSQTDPTKHDLSDATSPFNSPPGSPKADGEETPPQLPTRPRPQHVPDSVVRPRSEMGSFDPPPVHRSVAMKRRDRTSETNGAAENGHSTQHFDDEAWSSSFPKSFTHDAPRRPVSAHYGYQAPPRPPRPNTQNQTQQEDSWDASKSPMRINSNPATQQLPLPSPKTHGRSKTVDRAPDRIPLDVRPAQSQDVEAPQPSQAVNAVTGPKTDSIGQVLAYPDCSSTNRRPPFMKKGCDEVQTKYDPRIFDVCGEFVCTSGQLTRLWNIMDGELQMSLSHTEGTKATAVAFKPAADPEDEGSAVWIGTNTGELMEVDLATHSITPSKGSVHQRREVTRIYRRYNHLWTLDELGTLLVWGPDETGVPNVSGHPHQSYKLPRDHTFSMVVGDELWHATGREIRVFAPTLDGRVQFQVLIRPLVAEGAGDVTSGTLVKTQPGKAFFGHADGKVSIFSTTDYSCLGVLNISTWKMNALVGVGHRIWVGYNTGKVCVYDMGETPWTILKEWQAHSNPVIGMKCDPASSYRLDRVQVVSLGADNKIGLWDGLLEDDWVEDEMKSKDTNYCDFEELRALVFTWNAGASTPYSLRYSGNDGTFFPDLLESSGSPDILVFGFQELVDLEDKTATAKRFLKVKKKEGTDQEKMSHQYRDWRDFLVKNIDDYMPGDDLYHLLHSAPLVGLFTCVFVKASLRDRIQHLSGAEVKRGMGGLHGNKGAVAVRFQIDDSSVCFVNCHLAAGQSQANARHNDIAEILESTLFPSERDYSVRIDSFAGGGDGSMVLDHELCVLNGDLNYRIDTMSRDTVVGAVKQNNLAKLLDRDQLLVARRRNPAFRLRAFEELPITFAPTYKYDVGTDQYDTSEKRRSPAWCDRLLFRGRGRVQQLDYRRHEIYVSDHRPVTGDFSFWVKRVRPQERAVAWMESQQSFEAVRQRETADEKLHYLTSFCGYDEATSKRLLKEKPSRRAHRSPSRTREGY